MKTNFVKMSLAAAMLLSSSAYAGKIIGVDAGAPYVAEPLAQYSFGGWNFDNVNVKITDLEFVEIAKTFDTSDGTYDTMVVGDTFESEILDADLNVIGLLHGKNWPVGEPAGIKVINNDKGTQKSGKSPNCIMTTSYLDATDSGTGESGYLDTAFIPVPTVCSSPFQSHKRFKINMVPDILAGYNVTTGYGKPLDMVFNLDLTDTNTTARNYQVFQKINNYTGMRLEGYKIEVLDENNTPNDNIKFSLDLSDKEGGDENGYIAKFSRGLWGPKDEKVYIPPHFETDGFFDDTRAGFTQEGNNSNILIGGPATLGSNYEALFGIWLPSKWAPYGIFFDNDGDPTTDAELVAFWGTVPNAPAGTTPAWHKGNDYNDTNDIDPWELVTAAELDEWNVNAEGSLYSIGKIEDTLNLGLDYVVVVGENKLLGEKFTVRITPKVAADQTPPNYIDGNGDYILPPELIDPTVPSTGGGGGGGCTYNPNSKNFDMTFLMLAALGLLYPFRRRFLK